MHTQVPRMLCLETNHGSFTVCENYMEFQEGMTLQESLALNAEIKANKACSGPEVLQSGAYILRLATESAVRNSNHPFLGRTNG